MVLLLDVTILVAEPAQELDRLEWLLGHAASVRRITGAVFKG
jgi:hypothetical protein